MPLMLTDRKWHPVDDGALPYALAAMRALWVWPLLHMWARGLMPGRGDVMTWSVVFGLLALSTLVAQVAAFRVRSGRHAALLVAISGLAAVMVALYLSLAQGRLAPWDPRWLAAIADDPFAAIPALLVAIWLWWWGVLAGRDTLYYDTCADNFALGAGGLGLAAIISYTTGIMPLATLLGPVLAFFAVGLGALAVASLHSAQRYERERDDATFSVSRYWLGTVVGVVAVLLVAGLLVAQLFTPEVLHKLLALLSAALDLLARLLYWVILAFARVAFKVLGVVARLIRFRPGANVIAFELKTPTSLAEQFQDLNTRPIGLSAGAYLTFHIIAGLLIAGVILLIFALAFRRFRTYFEEDVEEIRESVLSLDLLRGQLAQIFKRKGKGAAPKPFVMVDGDDPRAQVRRTYQALLAWAARQDIARPPGMTPEEYLRLLSQALPEHSTSLAAITAAYVRARYSIEPVPMAVAQETARAWEQIAGATPEI